MTPITAAIIADDLTGACDAAIHFADAGLPTQVSLTGTIPPAEVIAFSTDTRDVPESEIRRRLETLAQTLRPLHPKWLFKKIDSALRGRPGLEIAIALEAFHCDLAFITPAYPDLGRLLTAQGTAAKLQADGLDLTKAKLFDIATNQDLDQIVRQYSQSPQRILWCGSGGLALAIARSLPGHATSVASPAAGRPSLAPVAFCIGSDHPATLAQIAHLRTHHPAHTLIPLPRGLTTPAQIQALFANAPKPAALFVTGGDTATLLLSALSATSITLRGEIVRGVPWGTIHGGIMDQVPVVTKSGGFGAPDTLQRIIEFFQ